MNNKNQFKESLNSLGYTEVTPKPSREMLQEYYGKKYFQAPEGSYAVSYTGDEIHYFRNVARVAQRTAEKLHFKKTLLDLGCGEGYFADAFLKSGWEITCCDFSEFGVSRHNPDLMPYFRSGDILESVQFYKQQGKTFGMVNLQNVLEHVIDPIALLTGLKPLLDPEAAVRIRVPNDYSDFQMKLVEKGYTANTWFAPPDHLSYFNKQGLEKLIAHCGYKTLSLQADFPIELFLANPHSNYWKNRELGKGAHLTRIFCENFLIGQDIDAYINYSEAAGRLGFGRELIAYVSPL